MGLYLLLKNNYTNIRILTSTGGGTNHYEIAKQKMTFLANNDIFLPITFATNTKNKASFARDKSDVLFDDRDKVLAAWSEAGGTAVKFDSANMSDNEYETIIRNIQKKKYGN